MSNIYISLENNLSCEKICYRIQKLLDKYKGHDLSKYTMIISMSEILESNESLLPKLEFKK